MNDLHNQSPSSALIALPDDDLFTFFAEKERAVLADITHMQILDVGALSWDEIVAQKDMLSQVEILITGWATGTLTDKFLDLMPKLRLVAHTGGTVKNLLPASTWRRNISVVSCTRANAIPVAEFTLAAILFANKHVLQLSREYGRARCHRSQILRAHPEIGNHRKVVGIVSASTVGRLVVEMLRPFDLVVQLYDPLLSQDDIDALQVRVVDLDTLLRTSDVISLHAPLLETTRNLIGAAELAKMRDDATLINTARGAIVDQDALESELISGRINAFIDTTEFEPLPKESRLYDLPNLFLTPHIAGSAGAELRRLGRSVVEDIKSFQAGEKMAGHVAFNQLDQIA